MNNTTNNWLKDGLDILNPCGHELSPEVLENMRKLCEKLQQIQDAYGQPLVCNSGYRTPEEQMRVNPKAPNSWHCKGAAIDVSDKDGKLWNWLNSIIEPKEPISENRYDYMNEKLSKLDHTVMNHPIGQTIRIKIQADDLDVYLEDRVSTPTWVHIQIYPPKSGHRIFKP